MSKKRIAFIVNPISGTCNKDVIPTLIGKHIDATIYDTALMFTEYAGHASEIASRCAAEGYDIVVAVGGDGTVNEVARALAETPTALGIVPCGSGNGLARHLMLPMNFGGALDIINMERVFINFQCETKKTKQIKPGDMITVRGKGRFFIKELVGQTKSGRTIIKIEKFV